MSNRVRETLSDGRSQEPGELRNVILQSESPKSTRAMYNKKHRASMFVGQQIGDVVDIDGAQSQSAAYDPTYGWSIWMNQRNLEQHSSIDSPGVWKGSSSSFSSSSTPLPAPMAFAVRQPELDDSMRCALLGWLSEVAAEYKMANSTFFLTVRLLDRVLMQLPIKKTKFQLLGCACLMLAGKLEEIEAPTIENLVLLADSSFDVEALVNMEHTVLRMLEFKVSVHTTCYFAARLALAARMSEKEHRFMEFLLEISLNDFMLSYEPLSKVAAAAAHLTIQSLRALDAPVWSDALEHYSGYSDRDHSLRALVLRLRQLHWVMESSPYAAVGKKYSKVSHHKVSLTAPVRIDHIRFTKTTTARRVPEMRLEDKAEGVVEVVHATAGNRDAPHAAMCVPVGYRDAPVNCTLETAPVLVSLSTSVPVPVCALAVVTRRDQGTSTTSDTITHTDKHTDTRIITARHQNNSNSSEGVGCSVTADLVRCKIGSMNLDVAQNENITDNDNTEVEMYVTANQTSEGSGCNHLLRNSGDGLVSVSVSEDDALQNKNAANKSSVPTSVSVCVSVPVAATLPATGTSDRRVVSSCISYIDVSEKKVSHRLIDHGIEAERKGETQRETEGEGGTEIDDTGNQVVETEIASQRMSSTNITDARGDAAVASNVSSTSLCWQSPMPTTAGVTFVSQGDTENKKKGEGEREKEGEGGCVDRSENAETSLSVVEQSATSCATMRQKKVPGSALSLTGPTEKSRSLPVVSAYKLDVVDAGHKRSVGEASSLKVAFDVEILEKENDLPLKKMRTRRSG